MLFSEKCSTNVIMSLINNPKFNIKFGSKYLYNKFKRLHDEDWKKEHIFEIDTDCGTGIITKIKEILNQEVKEYEKNSNL